MVINQIITNFQADSLNIAHLVLSPGASREGHSSRVGSEAGTFTCPLVPPTPTAPLVEITELLIVMSIITVLTELTLYAVLHYTCFVHDSSEGWGSYYSHLTREKTEAERLSVASTRQSWLSSQYEMMHGESPVATLL